MGKYLIEILSLKKKYFQARKEIEIIKSIDLSIRKNEFVSIMGPSGSGKSTLLNIIGCLDRPTSGSYCLDGRDMNKASDKELASIRGNKVGFVFQNFNLLNELSVIENVKLPFFYNFSVDKNEAKALSDSAIKDVGLSHRLNHKPSELSGGEMQRVAIARAIAVKPKVLLADEPTGNLDSKTGNEIINLLKELNNRGTTILLVTHDQNIASKAEEVKILRDGVFV